MAFPQSQLGLRVDLKLPSVSPTTDGWVNITSDVRVEQGVTIRRGRADQASRPDPQTANLSIDNRTGKYSPRNPTSPYYGVLGRNTPLRVGVGTPPLAAASVSLVGSTSLVAPSVTAESSGLLICTWGATPAGNVTGPGGFTMGSERDGTLSTWQRGAKLVSAGATGTSTATFSTSATAQCAASVWVPGATTLGGFSGILNGSTVTLPITGAAAGHTLIVFHGWSSDPDDEMVRTPFLESARPPGWVLLADSGPSAGPRIQAWALLVTAAMGSAFNVVFDSLTGVDNFGRVELVTDATVYYPRFCGEVSSWPVTWDLSGADVATPIVASGPRRRHGTGATPLRSAMYRRGLITPSLRAYWPLEDDSAATSFASAVGGDGMAFVGTPQLAADSGFLASDALPTFASAGASGRVPAHTTTNEFTVGALFYLPTGLSDEATLLSISTTGTARTWTVKYEAALAGFRIECFDGDGASLENWVIGPWTGFAVIGCRMMFVLRVAAVGANLGWTMNLAELLDSGEVGVALPSAGFPRTIASQTVGRASKVKIGGGDVPINVAAAVGHVFVSSSQAAWPDATWFAAVNGYAGYAAAVRMRDLCREADVLLSSRSIPTSSVASERVGVQRPRTFLEMMDEAADADGGVLCEPRGFIGYQFRERLSKVSQASALTLSYTTPGHVGYPLEPVDDDQATQNDVTVTRIGGTSVRLEQTTGPLSTAAPPNGVGRYESSAELSLYKDSQVADRAGWMLHLGTTDETRWPAITTQLEAVPSLIPTVAALEVGDLVTLTDLPAWVPPGPTKLILEGYTETLGPFMWRFEGNYGPGAAWSAGILDDTVFGRLDSEGATLSAGVSSVATAPTVATASGHALWIQTATHPTEFPFDVMVGGERWTVTGITGATSPQTFNVTRSVNGVVKSHAAGTQVRLAEPIYLA